VELPDPSAVQNAHDAESLTLVRKIMQERDGLLTLFSQTAALTPFEGDDLDGKGRAKLEKFCEVLMDYVAAGHFSLFEHIFHQDEPENETEELAQKLYNDITVTSDIALDFNDKYTNTELRIDSQHLHDDLSVLGEALAARMDMEEELSLALCHLTPKQD
jgi:regulator of sigma D